MHKYACEVGTTLAVPVRSAAVSDNLIAMLTPDHVTSERMVPAHTRGYICSYSTHSSALDHCMGALQ